MKIIEIRLIMVNKTSVGEVYQIKGRSIHIAVKIFPYYNLVYPNYN